MEKSLDDKQIKAMHDIVTSETPDVSLVEFTQALLSQFGGPELYAKRVFEEFNYAQPGSVARQKALDMVGQLVFRVANIQKDATNDLSLASEEELGEMMEAMLGTIMR